MNQRQQGAVLALLAYSLWSLAPIYFKALDFVSAAEVLAHRIVWTFVLTLIAVFVLQRYAELRAVVLDKSKRLGLLLSTLLVSANWGGFIWAVQNDQILNASLGYYINPLISILLGMVFLKEKLSFTRKIAAGLCLVAVLLELVNFGRLPFLALMLATSFGLYGLVRKKLALDSVVGLACETGLLLPLAIAYLLLCDNPAARFYGIAWHQVILLLLAGPVTMVPLVCFAAAANRISLAAMGFFQYVAPTGMLLLAIFLYGEPFSDAKKVTFFFIWVALGILVMDSVRRELKRKHYREAGSSV